MSNQELEREIHSAISDSDRTRLERIVARKPLSEVLPACRSGLLALADGEDLSTQATWRHHKSRPDRLGAILTIADELRMPQFKAALGPFELKFHDNETDYDHARTFILREREQPGFTPSSEAPRLYGEHPVVPGRFYPEYSGLPRRDKILYMVYTHAKCRPFGDKNLNLLSQRGRFRRSEAKRQADPKGKEHNLPLEKQSPGTTCGIFMRAILFALGDKRFEGFDKAAVRRLGSSASERVNMNFALGCAGHTVPVGPAWVQAKRSHIPWPKAGDLYFIRVLQHSWDDSGHVGFIDYANDDPFDPVTVSAPTVLVPGCSEFDPYETSASGQAPGCVREPTKTRKKLRLRTIDGGQDLGVHDGNMTNYNTRNFQLNGHEQWPWRQQDHLVNVRETLEIDGEKVTVEHRSQKRVLFGWVNMDHASIAGLDW